MSSHESFALWSNGVYPGFRGILSITAWICSLQRETSTQFVCAPHKIHDKMMTGFEKKQYLLWVNRKKIKMYFLKSTYFDKLIKINIKSVTHSLCQSVMELFLNCEVALHPLSQRKRSAHWIKGEKKSHVHPADMIWKMTAADSSHHFFGRWGGVNKQHRLGHYNSKCGLP